MPLPACPSACPIALKGVSMRFGAKEVIAPLDLTLLEARIAIIGRNGSGKSTLLRLIGGLVAPTTGRVQAGADDLVRDRRAALRHVGILFQNPEHQILFPTVVEELAFGLIQMGLPRAEAETRARAALKDHGRAPWADASVAQLSGGQKQYLCLLALLLMNPTTLLLDEPFASLDLPATLRLKRELSALPNRLILITHRPDDIRDFERVIWLDGGRIRQDGPPATVLPAFEAAMEEIARHDADTDLAL